MDELYEAWDFQQKFGGPTRPAAASGTENGQEADCPPQFKTFVPGKSRVPKRAPPIDTTPNGRWYNSDFSSGGPLPYVRYMVTLDVIRCINLQR